MTIELKGAEDFTRFAAALKEAGDKELSKAVGKALRTEAKPLGEKVVQAGAERMPHRGGLSALIAQSRVSVRFSQSRNPSVTLALTDKSGHDLRSLDRGVLRHPVFLRKRTGLFRRKTGRGKTGHVLGGTDRKGWTWTAQRVPAGAFTEAFDRNSPPVVTAVTTAVQAVLDDAARKAR